MRIKSLDQKVKKKTYAKALLCVDFNYAFHEGDMPYPLYSIVPEGKHFEVLYHGVCPIYSSNTFEGAKAFVESKVNKILYGEENDEM